MRRGRLAPLPQHRQLVKTLSMLLRVAHLKPTPSHESYTHTVHRQFYPVTFDASKSVAQREELAVSNTLNTSRVLELTGVRPVSRRARGSATPAPKFSVAEIMLPDHLLLRVGPSSDDRVLANWPAYKFGVEEILRAYGLKGHIAEKGDSRRSTEPEQWEAEEELCRAIIVFNVKDFTEVFGGLDLGLSEVSAGDIWRALSDMKKAQARPGMMSGWEQLFDDLERCRPQ